MDDVTWKLCVSPISVYNTCTPLVNNEKYVDANLDAPDNAISGNDVLLANARWYLTTWRTYIFIKHACVFILLQAKAKYWNEPKDVMPKS